MSVVDKHTPDFRYLRGLKPVVFSVDECIKIAEYRDKIVTPEGRLSEPIIILRNALKSKDTRIAELEAHQEYQLREEGALRDTIDRLKADLTEELAKVKRLREALTNIHDYGIDRDGETTSEKLGELVDELVQLARDALAATAPKEE